MAGHGYVKHDPAIERWNAMREAVWKHFRFTRQTTKVSIIGLVIVPAALYALASSDDVKWDWKGKRKGQSLLRIPPTVVEPTEE